MSAWGNIGIYRVHSLWNDGMTAGSCRGHIILCMGESPVVESQMEIDHFHMETFF